MPFHTLGTRVSGPLLNLAPGMPRFAITVVSPRQLHRGYGVALSTKGWRTCSIISMIARWAAHSRFLIQNLWLGIASAIPG